MKLFRLNRSFAPGLLGALLCIFYANIASAHAHLISAQPADGVVLFNAPNEVRLTFSEGLSKLSGATIGAANKADNPLVRSAIATDDEKILIIHFDQPLGSGKYTVNWRALAKDGHTTHGSYDFAIQP